MVYQEACREDIAEAMIVIIPERPEQLAMHREKINRLINEIERLKIERDALKARMANSQLVAAVNSSKLKELQFAEPKPAIEKHQQATQQLCVKVRTVYR